MLTIQENIPLAAFTTFRIGGNARYFARVSTDADIVDALKYAMQKNIKVFILGGGSNILFCDTGFDGLVIKLEKNSIDLQDKILLVGAGAMLSDVVAFAGKSGLSGMELLAGIPGTIGGAVRGNAGAFGVEIGSLIRQVTFLNTQTLEMETKAREACDFSYRQSFFKKMSQSLIVSVELSLQTGDRENLARIAKETIAKREAKHPQTVQCAGSFFMNPQVANTALLKEFQRDAGVSSRNGVLPAGWIIEYVGLKGKTIGGAQISTIHPNYLVNIGNATAEDVLILASIVKQRVRTQLDIRLQEEIQMVGF